MKNATTRTKALVAGGAALLAFGIGTLLPAQANPPAPSPTGQVGQAWLKANPPGQSKPGEVPGDDNNGFTCDGNGGVGNGNPALNPVCPTPTPTPAPPPPAGTDTETETETDTDTGPTVGGGGSGVDLGN